MVLLVLSGAGVKKGKVAIQGEWRALRLAGENAARAFFFRENRDLG